MRTALLAILAACLLVPAAAALDPDPPGSPCRPTCVAVAVESEGPDPCRPACLDVPAIPEELPGP